MVLYQLYIIDIVIHFIVYHHHLQISLVECLKIKTTSTV